MTIEDLFTCQPRFTGVTPPTIASAATIAPRTFMTVISGTVQIANITPPIDGPHLLSLIFTDAAPGEFLTSGNIAAAITPGQNNAVLLSYNPLTGKYYPTNSSSGGSSGGLSPHQASFIFTDAQVKNSPSTPLEVIPPTEVLEYAGLPTKVPIILLATAFFKSWVADYANIHGDAIVGFFYGSDAGNGPITYNISGSNFLTGNEFLRIFNFSFAALGPDAASRIQATHNISLLDSMEDNGVYFSVLNSLGPLTDGDVGNVLVVTVSYVIFNTATGEYE